MRAGSPPLSLLPRKLFALTSPPRLKLNALLNFGNGKIEMMTRLDDSVVPGDLRRDNLEKDCSSLVANAAQPNTTHPSMTREKVD
jgi:hypothetical protein